jgi:hypothetical protein
VNVLSKPKKRTVIWTAAGVLAVGIAVPTLAYAADPTPAPSTSAGAAENKGNRDEKLAAALATELGLDQQKVADALAKVREQLRPERPAGAPEATKEDHAAKFKERLDQAVKDGKLTQAEADAIAKAQAAGVLGGPGGHGRGPGGRPAR